MKQRFEKKQIIIVIPTYNEAQNIRSVLKQIFSLGISISVLVVDDNSPDRTFEEVEKLQDEYPHLYLLKREAKFGLGKAYIAGFQYALENGYDVIIQMDADLSHHPSYIPEMLNLADEYDLIVGSRYIKKGGVSSWPAGRILLSRLANVFSKALLRIPVNDLTSGFKCVRKRVLENVDFAAMQSKGYAFQIEMVYRAFLNGFRIIEYPIVFEGRKNEKSKMSLNICIEAFLRTLYLFFTTKSFARDRQLRIRGE